MEKMSENASTLDEEVNVAGSEEKTGGFGPAYPLPEQPYPVQLPPPQLIAQPQQYTGPPAPPPQPYIAPAPLHQQYAGAPPPYQEAPGYPGYAGVITHTVTNVPMANIPPKDYMALAIIVTIFFCWPLGVMAIRKASESRTALAMGDIYRAHDMANRSRNLSLSGLGVGVGVIIFLVVFFVILN